MLRKIGCALLAALLGGCAMTPLIDRDALEFNKVQESVNNELLVTNILRARDNAPLYLAEFQTIHVTITGTLSTGNISIPFGPGNPPLTKRYTAQPNASIQSAPSFDATQLDTQQFTLGMLRPIEPVTWEYYWHRDYPPQLLLYLFLASINDGLDTYDNNPCWETGGGCASWAAFNKRADDLVKSGVYLNIFSGLAPAQDTGKVGSQPIKVVVIEGKPYTFEESAPQVAICVRNLGLSPADEAATFKRLALYQKNPCPDSSGTEASQTRSTPAAAPALLSSGGGGAGISAASTSLSPEDMALFACTHHEVVQCRRSWADVQRSSIEGQTYVMRSVESIIRYLGRVQQMVEADPRSDEAMKGVVWTDARGPNTLFQLHLTPGRDRIAVGYRGRRYYVREGLTTDHTLEVLALLNQLINANKNASEIPSTKAVQIVP
jgi:hypothetical protein